MTNKALEKENHQNTQDARIDRVIEMAWEDRTPFEAIHSQFGLSEKSVIAVMRRTLKSRSFKRWRARTSGRKTKHLELRHSGTLQFRCPTQHLSHKK